MQNLNALLCFLVNEPADNLDTSWIPLSRDDILITCEKKSSYLVDCDNEMGFFRISDKNIVNGLDKNVSGCYYKEYETIVWSNDSKSFGMWKRKGIFIVLIDGWLPHQHFHPTVIEIWLLN